MPAKDAPLTRSAGQTCIVSRQPTMLRTSQSGRISEIGGRMRPAIALNAASGSRVTPASVRMGFPTPPHATGAVLATRHSVAAWNGGNPRPIRNEPAIATGAPPPPAPSRNAPKQNAISTNWSRLSDDSPAIESFITSNWPVSHAMLYRKIEPTTIQAIRISPKITPCAAAVATRTAGMPNTNSASDTATRNPLSAAIQTRFFNATRTKKSVTTGSADTAVDNTRLPNGSYSCDQDMRAV